MPIKKGLKKSKALAISKPVKAIGQKQTKSQIFQAISEETGLSQKEVRSVFEAASHFAKCHLANKGSGEFTVPEMAIKIVRKSKPATKQREGRNPLTGEPMTIAAKPKRDVIKVRVLKALKDILISD